MRSLRRLTGWFVVVLIISTGFTIWWKFYGQDVFGLQQTTGPISVDEEEIDYTDYYNFDLQDEIVFVDAANEKDPKEIETKPVVALYDPLLEFRLARDIARENATFGLEKLASSGNLDASVELLNQTKTFSKEEELEGILKAKGYGDTVISIEAGKVQVVAKDLSKEKVEAIGELIKDLTSYGKEQIVLTSI